MRTRGATQLAVWLVIGAAALAFLYWQDDHIDRDSAQARPIAPDSSLKPGKLDTLPKPFAKLTAPAGLRPKKTIAPVSPTKLRAEPGEPVPVVITAYCLQGRTRMGTGVREGVIAADPRVFPLSSEIDLIIGNDTLGRFRVEDTGLLIKGRKLDVWVADCLEARIFGRKKGHATLVAKIRR